MKKLISYYQQRLDLQLKRGDTAWLISKGTWATVEKVHITGRCPDGPGYRGRTKAYPNGGMHTCNFDAMAITKEAAQEEAQQYNKTSLKMAKLQLQQARELVRYLKLVIRHPERIQIH